MVGFNHRSVTETPEQNAQRLLALLRDASWNGTATIDMVTYSRGGLVARWLIERLLPDHNLPLTIRNVAFVAAANGGTPLADRKHWQYLIDLTTNLAVAPLRLAKLSGEPNIALAARVFSEAVSGLSDAAKMLTSIALDPESEEHRMPGLASMDPSSSPLLQTLNESALALRPDQTASLQYYTVVANFETELGNPPDLRLTGMPSRFTTLVADAFVDALFDQAPNDLVVPNASTTTVHPDLAAKTQALVTLEKSPVVTHLSLMLSPKIAEPLRTVLGQGPEVMGTEREFALSGTTPEALVDLYMQAEAPEEAALGDSIFVEVQFQREPFASQLGVNAGREVLSVDEELPLLVDVLPRRGFEVVDDHLQEVPCPDSEGLEVRLFELRAVEKTALPAEIYVSVRQAGRFLAQIELRTRVVDATSPDVEVIRTPAVIPSPSGKNADHQLFVSYFNRAQSKTLQFTVLSQAVGESPEFPDVDLPPRYHDRLQALYGEIEAMYADTRQIDTFDQRLVELGKQLARELMPDALRTLLWAHREHIQGFCLVTDEPFIPWEMVYLESPDLGEGCFLAEIGFTRQMRGRLCPDQLSVRPERRFTAVPRYPSQLSLQFALAEERWLHQHLGAAPLPDDLAKTLASGLTADLLHFAGHGDADDVDAYLVLGGEVDDGRFRATLFSSQQAGDFELQGAPLVFLNACNTGRRVSASESDHSWARKFLVQGKAGAFLAPLWSVGDQRATHFSATFYEALHNGACVADAVAAARREARAEGDPTWLSYAVYAQPHAKVAFEVA